MRLNSVITEVTSGRFLIKTLTTRSELLAAYQLRYQSFQVEMAGMHAADGFDEDEFDLHADHIGIVDQKSGQLAATARLICSGLLNKFYSAQEFECAKLISNEKIKLEIGRVCIAKEFRNGIIVILLWRAIAEYVQQSKAEILFGCGSVLSVQPEEIVTLYRYLQEQNKIKTIEGVGPKEKYRSAQFEQLLSSTTEPLSEQQRALAKKILPPLCQLYFNIGCFVPCTPAFDPEFRCFDFLTVLDLENLDAKLKQKMFGSVKSQMTASA